MSELPVVPAHRLQARAEEQRWLVESLWAEQAVGIVGGEPKCCKSFLALDMAVAVASGAPCLRRFAVPRPGRVLLYAAEDAQHIVRARLEGICAAAGVDLGDLDVHVITAPTLRLDQVDDQRRLDRAVERLQPRLLILDPFVRLHRIDENASAEVAPLLARLRELQRRRELAVLLVHHARKLRRSRKWTRLCSREWTRVHSREHAAIFVTGGIGATTVRAAQASTVLHLSSVVHSAPACRSAATML